MATTRSSFFDSVIAAAHRTTGTIWNRGKTLVGTRFVHEQRPAGRSCRQNLAAALWSVISGGKRDRGGIYLDRTRLQKHLRAGFVLALLGTTAFSVAACGRNGPPEPPPGPLFSSYPPPETAPAGPAIADAAPRRQARRSREASTPTGTRSPRQASESRSSLISYCNKMSLSAHSHDCPRLMPCIDGDGRYSGTRPMRTRQFEDEDTVHFGISDLMCCMRTPR
jgi:hypothetical protein